MNNQELMKLRAGLRKWAKDNSTRNAVLGGVGGTLAATPLAYGVDKRIIGPLTAQHKNLLRNVIGEAIGGWPAAAEYKYKELANLANKIRLLRGGTLAGVLGLGLLGGGLGYSLSKK